MDNSTIYAIIILSALLSPWIITGWIKVFIKLRNYIRTSSGNKSGESSNIKIVHQITEALQDMSRKKVGAIITIEKNDELDNFRTDGVNMESKISSLLLISIFNKKSPLHDGAVVISDGRIKYAATYYKITNNSVSNKFGARHRAGLGISEQTDSVSIIVSEETGGISIAYKSKLIKIDPKAIQEKISEYIDKE